MRTILTLIMLAGIPAFCQDATPKPDDNIVQKMAEMRLTMPGAHVFVLPVATARQVCSIPLLAATAPGKPVPMPRLAPPRGRDQINAAPPAPACKPTPPAKP